MKKIEEDFSKALSEYLDVRERLHALREKLNTSAISKSTEDRLAALVAKHYGCLWYRTSMGSISFTDSLDNIRGNRRDDAHKFWRRTIFGLKS